MKIVWIGFFSLSSTLAFAVDNCPFDKVVGTYRVTNITCTGANCPSPQELNEELNSKLEIFKEPNTGGPNVDGRNPSNFAGWHGITSINDRFALDEKDKLLKPSSGSPYIRAEQSCIQKNTRGTAYRIFSTGQYGNEHGTDGTKHLSSFTETFTQNVTQGTYQLVQTRTDDVFNNDLSIVYSLEK